MSSICFLARWSLLLYSFSRFSDAFVPVSLPSTSATDPQRQAHTGIIKRRGTTTTLISAEFSDRRDFLASTASTAAAAMLGLSPLVGTVVAPSASLAAAGESDAAVSSTSTTGDLTSQLFNQDGSLKDGADVATEAKFRTVAFNWDPADRLSLNIDGANESGTASGKSVELSYQLPEKWGSGNNLYADLSDGNNALACRRISVYQAPQSVMPKQLEKASTIGVAKALDVVDDLKVLEKADLIGGKIVNRDEQRYFDFDMAVAPSTCGDSKENLGLGFCPYDSIYLLSATIVDEKMYVMAIQCDKDQWKRSNSDLRRLRSSFSVKSMA